MVTAIPVRHPRPRLGLAASLTAAARGLAFFGLTLAGFGLFIVVLAALFLIGLGAGVALVGNGASGGQRVLLALLLLGAGLGLARFGVPLALAALRRLAGLTRRLADQWCGVPITDRGRPRAVSMNLNSMNSKLSFTGRLGLLVKDGVTWRDLLWVIANLFGAWILAALPAAIVTLGLVEFIGPNLIHTIPPPAFPGNSAGTLFVLGGAIIATGVVAAPWLLRGYGLLVASMVVPASEDELELQVRHLSQTRTEALDTSAAEIRRIERDLHDGAQARLVAMGMTLDAAGQIMEENPVAARALLMEARDASVKALAELRDLVRGIHPPVLADRGLADAIRALALDSPMRIDLASDLTGRPPAPVESAAYFAVCELLANVSKHAEARQTWIDIRHTDEMLRIGVTDNGHGGADPALKGGGEVGGGLRGIERRLAPFDGVLAVSSPPGGPTAVTMEIPCALSSLKTSSC